MSVKQLCFDTELFPWSQLFGFVELMSIIVVTFFQITMLPKRFNFRDCCQPFGVQFEHQEPYVQNSGAIIVTTCCVLLEWKTSSQPRARITITWPAHMTRDQLVRVNGHAKAQTDSKTRTSIARTVKADRLITTTSHHLRRQLRFSSTLRLWIFYMSTADFDLNLNKINDQDKNLNPVSDLRKGP